MGSGSQTGRDKISDGIVSAFIRVHPRLILAAVALLIANPALAASPQVDIVTPPGGQVGTSVEISFVGDRLSDAEEILFYNRGITTESLTVVDNKNVKAKIKIAADCPLGEHAMRLRTKSGVSELRTFFVGPFPVVDEDAESQSLEAPQPVAMNTTVHGVTKLEDSDFYCVELKGGQPLSIEIEGMRLGRTMYDPRIAVLDANHQEIAVSDDETLLKQDAFIRMTAPADGKYIIIVRDGAYGGSDVSHYRLHIGDFPRPTVAFPAGGRTGTTLDVRMLDVVNGEITGQVKLPAGEREYVELFPAGGQAKTPSPLKLRASPFDNVMESEPNNQVGQPNETMMAPPIALNGVIETPGDIDCFRFPAKKDQTYIVRVYARQLRSPLDAVVNVYGPDNKHIQGSDDEAGGMDSLVRFKAAVDGPHVVRIRDHLSGGSPSHVYRIEVTTPKPSADFTLPTFDQRSQIRQTIAVPQGNRMATIFRFSRQDYGGELAMVAENLPAGMTMTATKVRKGQNDCLVVFETTPDAPVAGTLADLSVMTVGENPQHVGTYHQNVALVYGGNNREYHKCRVDRLATVVATRSPYSIRAVAPNVPLVRNGEIKIKIIAEREEGFDQPIRLRIPWLPPNVGASSTVTIPKDAGETVYTMNANSGAPIDTFDLAFIGDANIGNGLMWVSTPLMPLEIAESFVKVEIERGNVLPGETTKVICNLEHLTPFEGEAKIKIVGLPAHTSAAELTFTKDDKQVAFDVVAKPEARPSYNKSLYCQIVIEKHGEPIVHRVGHGGILRIDRPKKTDEKQDAAKKN